MPDSPSLSPQSFLRLLNPRRASSQGRDDGGYRFGNPIPSCYFRGGSKTLHSFIPKPRCKGYSSNPSFVLGTQGVVSRSRLRCVTPNTDVHLVPSDVLKSTWSVPPLSHPTKGCGRTRRPSSFPGAIEVIQKTPMSLLVLFYLVKGTGFSSRFPRLTLYRVIHPYLVESSTEVPTYQLRVCPTSMSLLDCSRLVFLVSV